MPLSCVKCKRNIYHRELAKKALEKVPKSEKPQEGLILHSDQGCQFTSWEFVSYCKKGDKKYE